MKQFIYLLSIIGEFALRDAAPQLRCLLQCAPAHAFCTILNGQHACLCEEGYNGNGAKLCEGMKDDTCSRLCPAKAGICVPADLGIKKCMCLANHIWTGSGCVPIQEHGAENMEHDQLLAAVELLTPNTTEQGNEFLTQTRGVFIGAGIGVLLAFFLVCFLLYINLLVNDMSFNTKRRRKKGEENFPPYPESSYRQDSAYKLWQIKKPKKKGGVASESNRRLDSQPPRQINTDFRGASKVWKYF